MILYVIGRALLIEAALLVLPLITAVIYGESIVPFLIPIVLLVAVGLITGMKKPKNASLFARDGLAVVALVWVFMSAFGALPFVISGDIPNYIDAFLKRCPALPPPAPPF